MRFLAAGLDGILVETEDLAQALALFDSLRVAKLKGVAELVPAARAVLVRFNPLFASRAGLREAIAAMELTRTETSPGQMVEIPVVYDGEDLAEVAAILGCSEAEVIRRHTGAVHTVSFTGFAPGFAYMSSDDPGLDVPRRKSPRVRIPRGSVALAGRFSGVYPTESPGGWQLIGRTTTRMWDLARERPALLVPGDRVRFRQVEAGDAIIVPALSRAAPATVKADACVTILRTERPLMLEDEGRPGQASQGVSGSGALDRASFRAVNEVRADRPVTLAMTGAPCKLVLTGNDGRRTALPTGRAFALDAGDILDIGAAGQGMVSYLGIRGGFACDLVMGSASRDVLAGIGPEPVVAGATLCAAPGPARAVSAYTVPAAALPKKDEATTVDIVLGPRDDWFTDAALQTLTTQDWRVTMRPNCRQSRPCPVRYRCRIAASPWCFLPIIR
jgi:KipI family sensor histidine kinase inhibitor